MNCIPWAIYCQNLGCYCGFKVLQCSFCARTFSVGGVWEPLEVARNPIYDNITRPLIPICISGNISNSEFCPFELVHSRSPATMTKILDGTCFLLLRNYSFYKHSNKVANAILGHYLLWSISLNVSDWSSQSITTTKSLLVQGSVGNSKPVSNKKEWSGLA